MSRLDLRTATERAGEYARQADQACAEAAERRRQAEAKKPR